MRCLRFFAIAGLAIVAFTSCTVVTSTNAPGKKQNKMPKGMIGRYELEYPGDLASIMEGAGKTYVEIKSDRLVIESEGEQNESLLNDSLYFSTIGKQQYLCLGKEPSLSVFKVVKDKKDLLLYTMCASDYIDQSRLSPYFSNVQEVPGEIDEDGQPGDPSFVVTIDDKKLDSYFKSDIPSKEPFRLKRQ
jgi:hypothetical protein